jgi:hypothetical protein
VAASARWIIALNAEVKGEGIDGKPYAVFDDPSGVTFFSERPLRASIPTYSESVATYWQLFGSGQAPTKAAIFVAGGAPVVTAPKDPAWTSKVSIRFALDLPLNGESIQTASIAIDSSTPVST